MSDERDAECELLTRLEVQVAGHVGGSIAIPQNTAHSCLDQQVGVGGCLLSFILEGLQLHVPLFG